MVAVQTTLSLEKEEKNEESVISVEIKREEGEEMTEKGKEVSPSPAFGGASPHPPGTTDDDVAVRIPLCEPQAESENKDVDIESGTENSSIAEERECKRLRVKSCIAGVMKVVGLLALLYLFICSLDLMSTAFKLLGGRYTGSIFTQSEIMTNPVAGLMVGVLATVLVQSSSTSTSIVVTMVASGIIDVKTAIPIVMGANIGTSVTNTLVSMTQAGDREVFERAFSGATVHDMFNWLTVLVLLPLEVMTGALFRLSSVLVSGSHFTAGEYKKQDLLKVITKPLTSRVVKLDKKVLKGLALGDEKYFNRSMILRYISDKKSEKSAALPTAAPLTSTFDPTTTSSPHNNNEGGFVIAGQPVAMPTYPASTTTAELMRLNETTSNGTVESSENSIRYTGSLFSLFDLSDTTVGIILLVVSLLLLCICLVLIVKLLQSMMKSRICVWVRKIVNAEFPGCFRHLTGYVAIIVGALMTVLVQSSSVFTSTLTPLVGVGLIEVDRMYPLTLGSNIGTTMTGILAALAASGSKIKVALQIALCHLFFNIIGILIFYPIPPLRRLPLRAAKFLGRITAKYRWFCILYLVTMFLLLPLLVFSLSLAGKVAVISAVVVAFALAVAIIGLNLLQKKFPQRLPEVLKSWDFLPEFLRSLEPYDRVIIRALACFKHRCPCCGPEPQTQEDQREKKALLHNNMVLGSPKKGDKNTKEMTYLTPVTLNVNSVASSASSFNSCNSNSPIVKNSPKNASKSGKKRNLLDEFKL